MLVDAVTTNVVALHANEASTVQALSEIFHCTSDNHFFSVPMRYNRWNSNWI